MDYSCDLVCIMCYCKNPSLICDGCYCDICDHRECITKTDGYILCGMCAYDKQKSVQDK